MNEDNIILPNALLSLKRVNIGYKTFTGTVKAVKNVTIDVFIGDSLGIVGESGSGKSTLAMGILRLLPQNAIITGQAIYKGKEDLLSLEVNKFNELRWKEISVVFQKSMNSFSPVHKIGEQIVDIYRVHEPKASEKTIYEIIGKLFSIVNLSARVLNLYPHQISGGMLQRIFISLSLMHRPKLVFFDEATTALDVVTQGQVLGEINRLQSQFDVTSVLITHDMSVVAETCNRVAVMYAGYIMEIGPVDTVMSKPSHPYTRSLISSFPNLRGERKVIRGIPGSLPNLKLEHRGCIFAPRCPYATEICTSTIPGYVQVAQNHTVMCHLFREV